MKTTYNRKDKTVIKASGSFAQRTGKVYNPKTQLFDLETVLGPENPRTGQIWCEDIKTTERDDFGNIIVVSGKWVEKEFIHFD